MASDKSPKPCSLSYKEIDEFAEGIASALQMKPGQDLKPIVNRLNGSVSYLPPECLTPATATIKVEAGKPPKFEIYLSSFVFPLRERFAIAHELGHLFMHSQYGRFDLEAAHNDLSHQSNLAEDQANRFARAFLITCKEFEKKGSGMSIIDMAAYFHVPLQVMEARRADFARR